MTAEQLKGYTLKVLGQMAKEQGVPGWHAMRKDQLVKALLRASGNGSRASAKSRNSAGRSSSRSSTATARSTTASHNGASRSASRSKAATKSTASRSVTTRRSTGTSPASRSASRNGSAAKPKPKAKSRPKATRRLQEARQAQNRLKDISHQDVQSNKDRLVVIVRPVLRLLEVQAGNGAAETVVRDIEIHGGVNNWYVPVNDPPQSYRLDIGYLSETGRMFVLARSNVVTTPRAGTLDTLDNNWSDVAENYEKIYAMSGGHCTEGASEELQELFEERLRRPMSSPTLGLAANGHPGRKSREFEFELDAELIVYGSTVPGSRVTLQGDPVELRSDGSFTVRFRLPNCRQVIPAVAQSSDGLEQRTIVLAVERNTKVMEPLVRDSSDL